MLRTELAKLLDFAAPSLRELAVQAGISYAAIRDYRQGRRTAPAPVVRRLSAVLRSRGGELQKLAAEVERSVGKRSRSGARRRAMSTLQGRTP
jgi:predicted transcriptional regulator